MGADGIHAQVDFCQQGLADAIDKTCKSQLFRPTKAPGHPVIRQPCDKQGLTLLIVYSRLLETRRKGLDGWGERVPAPLGERNATGQRQPEEGRDTKQSGTSLRSLRLRQSKGLNNTTWGSADIATNILSPSLHPPLRKKTWSAGDKNRNAPRKKFTHQMTVLEISEQLPYFLVSHQLPAIQQTA